MIEIGQYNILRVSHLTDFGAYLTEPGEKASQGAPEVLLPRKWLPVDRDLAPGDEVRVFVCRDSEDRPVATTETPFAVVGDVVFLQVAQVNRVGAFLDWGLEAKELLVPYSEQIIKMREGMQYLVRLYLDEVTGRVVATQRIDRFLGRTRPPYKLGEEVDVLVTEHIERVGYRVIVDNAYRGMIYENSLFEPLVIGSRMKATVKYVRDDNKIDLTPGQRVEHRLKDIASRILGLLADHPDHSLAITDRSTPEEVKALLGCSKKDFKRALGQLFKERRVALEVDRIRLVDA